MLRGAAEGLTYAWRSPRIRTVLLMMLAIATIGINFNVLLPVLTSRTLNGGPEVFGIISAVFGVGRAVRRADLRVAGPREPRVLLGGAARFSIGELVLAPLHTTWAVAVVLLVTGVAFSLYTSQSNAVLQLTVPDRLRGRILGLYGYVFFGTAPLGGLLAGWLAEVGGTQLRSFHPCRGRDRRRRIHGRRRRLDMRPAIGVIPSACMVDVALSLHPRAPVTCTANGGTAVEQRRLGSQGLEVSCIGLGCMGMSDFYGTRRSRRA